MTFPKPRHVGKDFPVWKRHQSMNSTVFKNFLKDWTFWSKKSNSYRFLNFLFENWTFPLENPTLRFDLTWPSCRKHEIALKIFFDITLKCPRCRTRQRLSQENQRYNSPLHLRFKGWVTYNPTPRIPHADLSSLTDEFLFSYRKVHEHGW